MNETVIEQKLKKGIKIKLTAFDVISMLIIAHGQLPAVGYYMPSVVCMAFVMAAFVISIMKITRRVKGKALFVFLPLFIIPLLGVISNLGSVTLVKTLESIYAIIQTYTKGLIATAYLVEDDKKAIKNMVVFVLITVLITSITTIYGCIAYPEASRELASLGDGDAGYALYRSRNIGSFSFVYGSIVVIPIIDVMFKTKSINRIFAAGLIVIIGIMTLKTEYTIALIAYLSLVLVFIIPKITTKKLLVLLILIVGVLIFAKSTVINVIENVIQNDESERRTSRYEYMEDVLNGKEISSTNENAARAIRYYKSWSTFLDTDGFGAWNSKSTGGHSYFLDNLAMYGLLGLAILLFEYIYYYVVILRKIRKEKYYASILWGYIVIIILSIINPKLNTFYLIFMIPLTCSSVYGTSFEKKTMRLTETVDEDTLDCE